MKNTLSFLLALLLAPLAATHAAEFHVSTSGSDSNPGTQAAPFRFIGAAALVAQPGDVVTVHKGTYREWVNPPRGGASDDKRIVYQAAPGEKAIIKGSEVITGWKKDHGTTWKVVIPNSFFGSYNPYVDIIKGDWFDHLNKTHHTGEVFLNGEALREAQSLDEVRNSPNKPHWYCSNKNGSTTIWANFQGKDPNKELVEATARQACFYPRIPGLNYITVRGFTMRHAATPWAPPTTEQIGLLGVNWSKGWIIEDNVISDAKCSGITLGKDGASDIPGKSESAEGYTRVVENAIKLGWSKETIGSHIVRNNTISNCGQTGICGSLGGISSQIIHNHIYNIHRNCAFNGAEIAGIKLHGAIDVLISENCIHGADNGLWLDWMAQGTRISRNLFYQNALDLFLEVNHGPFLVDNNVCMSGTKVLAKDASFVAQVFYGATSVGTNSQGGAFVHNLILGAVRMWPDERQTPYFPPHATSPIKMGGNDGARDMRFMNNFLWNVDFKNPYAGMKNPKIHSQGNVYGSKSQPRPDEADAAILPGTHPKPELVMEDGSIYLKIAVDDTSFRKNTALVTTASLGKAEMPDAPFEDVDGKPLTLDKDYLGKDRSQEHPTAGPFETTEKGVLKIKVWSPLDKPSK